VIHARVNLGPLGATHRKRVNDYIATLLYITDICVYVPPLYSAERMFTLKFNVDVNLMSTVRCAYNRHN
jgi:hypothetical protein